MGRASQKPEAQGIACFLGRAKLAPLVLGARSDGLEGWEVQHEEHKGPPTTVNGPPGTGYPFIQGRAWDTRGAPSQSWPHPRSQSSCLIEAWA